MMVIVQWYVVLMVPAFAFVAGYVTATLRRKK